MLPITMSFLLLGLSRNIMFMYKTIAPVKNVEVVTIANRFILCDDVIVWIWLAFIISIFLLSGGVRIKKNCKYVL